MHREPVPDPDQGVPRNHHPGGVTDGEAVSGASGPLRPVCHPQEGCRYDANSS